jgi:hypothetical protein
MGTRFVIDTSGGTSTTGLASLSDWHVDVRAVERQSSVSVILMVAKQPEDLLFRAAIGTTPKT